jgi:hypothetical protein
VPSITHQEASRQAEAEAAEQSRALLDLEQEASPVPNAPAVLFLGCDRLFDIGRLEAKPGASERDLAHLLRQIRQGQDSPRWIIR